MHVPSRCTARAAAARLAMLVAAGAVVLSAAGCTHADAGTRAAADGQGVEGAIGAAPSPDPTMPVQVDQTGPGGSTGGAGGNAGGYTGGTGGGTGGGRHDPHPSTSASPKTSWPAAPVIVYFRIRQQPKCKGSSHQGPVVPLIVEWQVTGADTVTLSTDGTAKNYPSSGTETYVFGCAGAAGTTDTHKYTLTADHDGTHATKSLTASAVVN